MAVNIKKEFGNNRNRKPDITSLVYGKIPPQATDIEAAVLGVLMLEGDKTSTVLDIIPSSDCFYLDAHQRIYSCIISLYQTGAAVDMLTITQELQKKGELELIGGAYYLTTLTMNVVSSAHVEDHARIIMEKYIGRELIRIGGSTIGDGYDDSMDVFELMNRVQNEIAELAQSVIRKQAQHIGAMSRTVTREVSEQRETNEETTGVYIGYSEFDKKIGGWQKTDLIILAARPAVGKTSFVLDISRNAATCPKKAYALGFFSLEMGWKQLVKRMQASSTGVKLHNILHPTKMQESEYSEYLSADKRLQQMPIYIDDTPSLDIQTFKVKARLLKQKYNIDMIIIDYLQLMKGSKKAGIREQEISEISRELKITAKELEIPIIALSQLNRGVENRTSKKPTLGDLRESGAIEQDADVVILMYRPGNDEEKGMAPQARGAVEFNIAKNRHGDTDEVTLYFEREIQKWHESSPYIFADFKEPTNHYKSFQNATQKPGTFQQSKPFKNIQEPDDLPF